MWSAWWHSWVTRAPWGEGRALGSFRRRQGATRRKAEALVKSHPAPQATLRYVLVDDMAEAADVLSRLTAAVRARQEKERRAHGSAPFLVESGRLPGKRPFLFVKPFGGEGFLFEADPQGFVVSRAVRIAERETFLRRKEAWDVVRLYRPEEGEGLLRLSSRAFGQEHLSYVVYQDRLLKSLAVPGLS